MYNKVKILNVFLNGHGQLIENICFGEISRAFKVSKNASLQKPFIDYKLTRKALGSPAKTLGKRCKQKFGGILRAYLRHQLLNFGFPPYARKRLFILIWTTGAQLFNICLDFLQERPTSRVKTNSSSCRCQTELPLRGDPA